jgi:hypothetical protein
MCQRRYNARMDLTLTELEEAINYWRRMRPATGEERALSSEVNTLANVYAMMIYQRVHSVTIESLETGARDLIDAWRHAREGNAA